MTWRYVTVIADRNQELLTVFYTRLGYLPAACLRIPGESPAGSAPASGNCKNLATVFVANILPR